jgi:hypothetical protein
MNIPPGVETVTVAFQSANLFANTEQFRVTNQTGVER